MKDPKKKIVEYKDLEKIRKKATKKDKEVVFLTGFFDLYHVGHASMLTWAKTQGDLLFIGLGPDEAAKEWKGQDRPIYTQDDRAYILACNQSVDYVLILDEPITPDKINFRKAFELISPDIFLAVSTDTDKMQDIRRGMAKEVGARLKIFDPFPRRKDRPSTTKTIKKIKNFGSDN